LGIFFWLHSADANHRTVVGISIGSETPTINLRKKNESAKSESCSHAVKFPSSSPLSLGSGGPGNERRSVRKS
jgi:hypothetical protein